MSDSTVLRILTSPQDTALDGQTVSSGRILEWIDRAGYACAVGWAKSYCVTAYVGNVRFSRAIRAGQLVELTARIIQTGSSSMQVLVTVGATDLEDTHFAQATDCLLVFVAVGEDGKPHTVRHWQPRSLPELELQADAHERLETRKTIRDAMLAENYSDRGTTPKSRLRFLAAPGDANWGGKAHGGTVMRWIHEAAYTCAAAWSSPSATASYSGGIHFFRPIQIGHVVEIEARLIHTSEHSMHVAVRVSSAPADDPRRLELTTVCMSIFSDESAIQEGGCIRPIDLVSDEDRRLNAHALALMELRNGLPPLPAAL